MLYLDYNGSAPLCKNVEKYLQQRITESGPYANPNANHFLGAKCLMKIEKSRKACADFLDCQTSQVVFNSGSSESISSVFNHIFFQFKGSAKNKILISNIEHAACDNAAKFLSKNGFEVIYLETNSSGVINLTKFNEVIKEHAKSIALICAMAANNETGVLQPYQEVGAIAQEHDILFLSDTTQLIGKDDFSFEKSKMDFACLAGHKIGALPGVGCLLIRSPKDFTPLVWGGNQENGLRGGTQNYIGVETLSEALAYLNEYLPQAEKIEKLRDEFEQNLIDKYPSLIVFGKEAKRICNTSFISLPGSDAQEIQSLLQQKRIFITTSSACSDFSAKSSKVLSAMNIPDDVAKGAIRISFGLSSHQDDFNHCLESLDSCYQQLT